MEEKIIEAYGVIGSDYLINYRKNNIMFEYNFKDKIIAQNYTLNDFENSKEYEELMKQFGNVIVKIRTNYSSNFILDMKNKKYTDKDGNEILIKDKNKYKILSIFFEEENLKIIKRLTLRQYIEAVKNVKELHQFKHHLIMDYNSDDVYIIFGENKYIVRTNTFELEDDDFMFDKFIDDVFLKTELCNY